MWVTCCFLWIFFSRRFTLPSSPLHWLTLSPPLVILTFQEKCPLRPVYPCSWRSPAFWSSTDWFLSRTAAQLWSWNLSSLLCWFGSRVLKILHPQFSQFIPFVSGKHSEMLPTKRHREVNLFENAFTFAFQINW